MTLQVSDKSNKKGITLETENVSQTITQLANKKNIPADKIDFDILDVTTTVMKAQSVGNLTEEVVIMEKKGRVDISEDIWLDSDVRIIQKYEILLYPIDPKGIHLHVGIAANAQQTNIVAFIKKEPRLTPSGELLGFLTNELNKRKLKHGFLIDIFDESMDGDLRRLCDLISQHGHLDRDVRVNIFNGPDFIPSIDDSIEYVYQKRSTIPGGSKFIGVSAGEALIEYIKPKIGKASRNAKGKYLNCFDPIKNHEIKFTVSNSIKYEDTEEKVIYSAINDGFAVFEDNMLDIKPELILVNLTAKTGSIDIGTNKNSKLNITSDAPEIDAVGDNVKIKAHEIDVKGNVGEDTLLEAEIVNIQGQTHRSSKIIAKQVDVKTHKGIIEAEDVKVGVLESGVISANNVKIASSLGATIQANECNIGILGSNSTIIISKLLIIESVSGSENKITITPSATKEDEKEFEDLIGQLKEITSMQETNSTELNTNMKTIEQSVAGAKALKVQLDAEKNREKAALLTSKLVAFNELVERTKLLKKQNEELDITRKSIVQTIQGIQDKILGAKVITEKPWRGHNIVKFKLIEPPMELSITVDEHNDFMELSLQKVNGEYSIHKEKRVDL
jgi:hypothetical protein